MSSAIVVATIALQGAAVGVSGELAVRSLFQTKDKAAQVRIGKFLLGLFMALKSIIFLSFHASQGNTCSVTGRLADLFYQLAMTAGTHVLVARVQSIVPVNWKRKSLVLHSFFTVLRCIIGVVDVGLIHIENYPDGSCKYIDEEFWGPVYTLYDTFIDVYVTVVISCILITHIRSLLADRMKVNKNLYTSVIYHNVFRTVCLTIVNLISAIFIIMQDQVFVIMLLWPIINIFFVILVGYDSDVTKSIRRLRQKRWRTLPTTTTSTVDLGRIPSITIPTKKDISTNHSDIELNTDVPDTKNNNNNNNSYNSNSYNSNNSNNNSDLSLIQLQLWKSRLSSTEQKIQEQAGYDTKEDGGLSLPNFQNRGSASYDTDNTLT